jgi:hypothetical protein
MSGVRTKKEDEFFFHFVIVLSNVSPEECDQLRARRGKSLRRHLHESGWSHQPECQGGYSNERCPCAWSAKMVHTLFAVIALDELRIGSAGSLARMRMR